VDSSAPKAAGPPLAACGSIFQFAVVSDCQTPLKFGVPSASRGMSCERWAPAGAMRPNAAQTTSRLTVFLMKTTLFRLRLRDGLDAQYRPGGGQACTAGTALAVPLDREIQIPVRALTDVAHPHI